MPRPHFPAALLLDAAHPARRAEDWEVSPSELRWMLRSGTLFPHLFRHPSARILLDDLDSVIPLKSTLALRCLTSGPVWVEDRGGRRVRIGTGTLFRLLRDWARDQRLARGVVAYAAGEVAALEAAIGQPRRMPPLSRDAGALFLHTGFNSSAIAGGSFAHLAGVLNELRREVRSVELVAASPVPTVDPEVETTIVPLDRRAWSSAEIHQLNANRAFLAAARKLAGAGSRRLIYQRYSLHNWTGARLAWGGDLPFVVEFNGSEPWLARNWSQALRFENLANRIEQANLAAADLVTVVSEPLRAHLLQRGIRDERILVNSNGVDADRFRPDRDGREVRKRFRLQQCCVVGFIGTFGPWHGAEALAEAFAQLLDRRPDLADKVRLLLIGDGMRLPAVRAVLTGRGRADRAIFTGLVPQAEAPSYLAACDILVAPTDLNPDGSEFFGSPTKIFEYMAMGRGIAATRIGQIADILRHEETALLVPPQRPDALAAAIERLVDDAGLRASLGAAARRTAVERHTWRSHVGRLFGKIEELSK